MPSRVKLLSKEEIEKTVSEYFGTGKKRRLRPGEGAILQKEVSRLIGKMHVNPEILLNNVSTIVKTLLGNANLGGLAGFPLCLRQVASLWKVILTREVVRVDQGKVSTPHRKKFVSFPYLVPDTAPRCGPWTPPHPYHGSLPSANSSLRQPSLKLRSFLALPSLNFFMCPFLFLFLT